MFCVFIAALINFVAINFNLVSEEVAKNLFVFTIGYVGGLFCLMGIYEKQIAKEKEDFDKITKSYKEQSLED